MKANDILNDAEPLHERVKPHLRDAADWFHDHEGEMFTRDEAAERLADSLDIDDDLAMDVVRNLVSDLVDPIVQVQTNGTKYVGVAEYEEFDGAYGYLDYHDTIGQRHRVVCAQCVHESEYDTEVTHATAGDGSFGTESDYEELHSAILDHYGKAHEETPENVKTGASLISGTTIGGNTSWHAGNDGGGSGLDADYLDGTDSSQFVVGSVDLTDPQDVTSNRTSGTQYSNNSGNPRIVSVHGDGTLEGSIDSTIVIKGGNTTDGDTDDPGGPRETGITMLVPSGSTYTVSATEGAGGTATINGWFEYEIQIA